MTMYVNPKFETESRLNQFLKDLKSQPQGLSSPKQIEFYDLNMTPGTVDQSIKSLFITKEIYVL